MEEINYKTFAFISDGDIFHKFRVEDSKELSIMIAGMQSNPIVVDISDKDYLWTESNWKYVDGEFVQSLPADPVQELQGPPPPIDEDDYEVE